MADEKDGKDKDKDGTGGNSKAPVARKREHPDFEIEFGDNRNRQIAWPIDGHMVRGWWKRANLISDELVEDLAIMPDLPGIRLKVEPAARVALLYDPLGLPEHAEECAKIQRIIKERFRVDQGPAKAVVVKLATDDDIKTWVYWAARSVHGEYKRARVVSGSVWVVDQVQKMDGRIRIENFNSSARACKWMEEFTAYIDRILSSGRAPVTV